MAAVPVVLLVLAFVVVLTPPMWAALRLGDRWIPPLLGAHARLTSRLHRHEALTPAEERAARLRQRFLPVLVLPASIDLVVTVFSVESARAPLVASSEAICVVVFVAYALALHRLPSN